LGSTTSAISDCDSCTGRGFNSSDILPFSF
jgi:hypothetical protein